MSPHRILTATMAAMVLALSACTTGTDRAPSRTAGEFTDDAALTAKVKTAIATDVGAKTAAAINVQTYRGVVQLSGFADSPDQAQRAASAARNVRGVQSVDNAIRIRPAS